MNVSRLLHELILHTCAKPSVNLDRADRNLIGTLLDQICAASALPFNLPMPTDIRAQRVANRLKLEPDKGRISHICRDAGASRRTIERLFIEETGLSFGKWRQQLRMLKAVQLLGNQTPIAQVALEVGYSTPSAFAAAFRKQLGVPPSDYFGGAAREPVEIPPGFPKLRS